MRVFLSIIFIFHFLNIINSQNLVLNGGFEDTLCCNSSFPTINCSANWLNIGTNSSDLDHADCIQPWVVNKYFDSVNEKAVAGLWNFFQGVDGSEYLMGKLISPLIQNHKYHMSFIIRPFNTTLSSDGIGVYFTENPIDSLTHFYGYLNPQLVNPSGNLIDDTTKWTEFSSSFIANGDEEYFVIGNFRKSDSTIWDTIGNYIWAQQGYVLIDNIKLFDSTEILPPIIYNDFEIYPNPVISSFKLESNCQNCKIILTNLLGQVIKEVNHNGAITEINISGFSNGVYFILLKNTEFTLTKKVLFSK